jgi:hypothetical protein
MENENWYMKQPCKHCPYRQDVKPFLRASRGEELAYHAQNPYNSFPCHKTTVSDDDEDERYCNDETKECAGFMTLQHIENDNTLPDGFIPNYDVVYGDIYEMIDSYCEDNEN